MNPDTSPTLRDQRFILFIALFAAFALVHELLDAYRWVGEGAVGIALGCGSTLAAAALLARPRSTPRLLVLLLLWTAHKVQAMPAVPNHILFTSIVNLTLLAALLLHAVRGRGGSMQRSLDELAAPPIRAGVIVLYGFAVLHKLNADYFDPGVSCGPQLFREMGDLLPVFPTGAWVEWPGIVGSLVAEAAIGLLLMFRRTRALAIAIGLLFHGLLVFHFNLYVGSFTALVFSLFALFLPLPYVERTTRWRPLPPAARYAPLATAMVVIAVIAGLAWQRGAATPDELRELVAAIVGPMMRVGVTLLYAAAIVVLGLRLIWSVRPFPVGDAVFRFGHPAFVAVPVLLLFNGFSPYLGLKTQTSFSMFSNLRTELRSTNHFFMPVGLRLAGYQERMVIVEETTSPALQVYCRAKEWIPLFELRRAAAEDTSAGFRVVYRRVGDPRRIVAARTGEVDPVAAEVFAAPSLLQRKLIFFRPVPPHGAPCSCRH